MSIAPANRAPEGCILRPSAPRAVATRATNARYAVFWPRLAARTRLLATASALAVRAALSDSAFTGDVLVVMSCRRSEGSSLIPETCAALCSTAGPCG